MSIIMLCLGNPDDPDYQSNEYQKLLRLLAVLADEEIQADQKLHIINNEYHLAKSRELEGKVNTMCNWSDGIVDRVTGKMIISSVENVVNSLHVSIEKACEILKYNLADYYAAKEFYGNPNH